MGLREGASTSTKHRDFTLPQLLRLLAQDCRWGSWRDVHDPVSTENETLSPPEGLREPQDIAPAWCSWWEQCLLPLPKWAASKARTAHHWPGLCQHQVTSGTRWAGGSQSWTNACPHVAPLKCWATINSQLSSVCLGTCGIQAARNAVEKAHY